MATEINLKPRFITSKDGAKIGFTLTRDYDVDRPVIATELSVDEARALADALGTLLGRRNGWAAVRARVA